MKIAIEGNALLLEQDRGARIQLDEKGSIILCLPLERSAHNDRSGFGGRMAVIEEDVMRELSNAISFAVWALERVDPTQKISHVAIAASIGGSDYLSWRTKAENDASPNSGSMGFGSQERRPITTDRQRGALKFQAKELAEDIMVSMRRQWKSRS